MGPPAWLFSLAGVGVVLAAALAFSLLYWGLVQIGARERLLKAMHCRPLDAGDRYHDRLANIVEEMRIATGGPRIECVTVRTVGFNAFAFSDLHGGGVIGVTEGALARLSRQQLQAVVAHEFAHILSGSYVTVTVSCLLFGIYSALVEQLDEAADAGADTDAASAALAMVPLRGWLWAMQVASSVVSAAISRERERQADLAAVRYTRDPLALAEALRIIGRHPGGAGYIPEGLAPLCIRATGTLGLAGRLVARHAPAPGAAHRRAAGRRGRLRRRLRAAGRAGRRGLRAPGALGAGPGRVRRRALRGDRARRRRPPRRPRRSRRVDGRRPDAGAAAPRPPA